LPRAHEWFAFVVFCSGVALRWSVQDRGSATKQRARARGACLRRSHSEQRTDAVTENRNRGTQLEHIQHVQLPRPSPFPFRPFASPRGFRPRCCCDIGASATAAASALPPLPPTRRRSDTEPANTSLPLSPCRLHRTTIRKRRTRSIRRSCSMTPVPCPPSIPSPSALALPRPRTMLAQTWMQKRSSWRRRGSNRRQTKCTAACLDQPVR
jgi:hypothetical protein